MTRQCRKCGGGIPNRVIIDGVTKTLPNRKFCLICSPYKKHNTKSDDPARKPRARKYSEFTEDQKIGNKTSSYKRGLQRKIKLIEMAGGKCQKCEYVYDGCERCLTFHHREPDKKKFPLCVNVLWGKKWEEIIAEFAKCDLLCVMCHTKLEDDLAKQRGCRKWLIVSH